MAQQSKTTSPGDDGAQTPGEEDSAPSPDSSASSQFPPADKAADEKVTAVPFVRYTTNGVTYDLQLAANGDLLYPETGSVAVTGSRQQAEGEPAEGRWVPLN